MAYTGRFLRRKKEQRGKTNKTCYAHRYHVQEEEIGGTDDLLRTSIAVDPDRVKPLATCKSSTSRSPGTVEPGDGLVTQLWLESGERVAGPVAGSTGRCIPATLAGMVL